MTHNDPRSDRRKFLATLAACTTGLSARDLFANGAIGSSTLPICAFEKFLQALSYEELADVIAELGFVGIEATVRQNGHVAPERVEDELPAMHEALKRRGLEITIMTTDIKAAEEPLTQRVLETGTQLGIKRYRMGHYRYDLSKPIWPQVVGWGPVFKELEALNKELGLQGLYQNHSGYGFFGATIWDLYEVIKDLDPASLGVAFDIRHATVEAGLSWEVLYRLTRSHLGAIYVKDYRWRGRSADHAPLGTSVDPRFFELLKQDNYTGPISLHVEYLPAGSVEENVIALRRDLATLRGWLH